MLKSEIFESFWRFDLAGKWRRCYEEGESGVYSRMVTSHCANGPPEVQN